MLAQSADPSTFPVENLHTFLFMGDNKCMHTNISSRMGAALLFPAFFVAAFLVVPHISDAAPCNVFSSGSAAPTGYGAAWNVFSSTKALLLTSDCATGERRVGMGDPNHLIYKKGYRHDGGWQEITFNGEFVSGSVDWLSGTGSATFAPSNLADAPNPYYWVAYICQWQASNSSWKCGCSDSACATNYWNLQGFDHGGGGTSGNANALQSQYPNLYNENLPFNGLFYGFPFSCDHIQLSRIGGKEYGNLLSFRFRAERSGKVSYVVYNNRYDPEGNGYSSGDGGRIHAEFRADDGSVRHHPQNAVLAKTESHTPGSNPPWRKLTFSSPVTVEAGKLYHVVFVQESGNYASTNAAGTIKGYDNVFGPYWGNDNGSFHKLESWYPNGALRTPRRWSQSYMSLGYTDGTEVGTGGWCIADNYPTIGGSRRIRQVFTVQGPDRDVNGVWFRAARKSGNTQPMIFELKNAGGAVIWSKQVAASQFSEGRLIDSLDILDANGTIRWTYVEFGKTIRLASGAKYSLELSSTASPTDGYSTKAHLDLVQRGEVRDRNAWSNAEAQISTNGGSSWTTSIEPTGASQGNDFGFGFTLEGGPKSIQSIANFNDGV
jgi:hypothetical protein